MICSIHNVEICDELEGFGKYERETPSWPQLLSDAGPPLRLRTRRDHEPNCLVWHGAQGFRKHGHCMVKFIFADHTILHEVQPNHQRSILGLQLRCELRVIKTRLQKIFINTPVGTPYCLQLGTPLHIEK